MDQAGAGASRGARAASCARARGDRRRFQAGAKSSASYDGACPRGHLWLGEKKARIIAAAVESAKACVRGERFGASTEWQMTRGETKEPDDAQVKATADAAKEGNLAIPLRF